MLSSSSAPSVAQPASSRTPWRELSRLRETILEHMPITQNLQFSLFLDAAERLVATAPLGPNANHQQTAFGGSLSMLATVAGWAMTKLVLRKHDCDAEIVIQKSQIEYRAPVRGDLALTCERPSEEEHASLFETLKRWGKARLPLRCAAEEDGEQAVVFDLSYVVLSE